MRICRIFIRLAGLAEKSICHISDKQKKGKEIVSRFMDKTIFLAEEALLLTLS
jgi:hypothetical protein